MPEEVLICRRLLTQFRFSFESVSLKSKLFACSPREQVYTMDFDHNIEIRLVKQKIEQMFDLFRINYTDLNSKLNQLESKIQRVQTSFFKASKSDWDDIFDLCSEIAQNFKNVRYPTREDRDAAWQRFYRLRGIAFEVKKSQMFERSKKHFDELMYQLHAADYDKLADVLVGEILSFGLMKTTANDMKAQGKKLKDASEYFKSVKHEMIKEHKTQVFDRITEVRKHHNEFWDRYKTYQKEKAKEWEERKKEREIKQKEWEARQKEKEQRKREWEARKQERERKQREWEARQAEYQRERERKQREYEERKRERERKKQEWEQRKANRSNKKKGGGGCYITTAICQTLGKPDDCEELRVIRSFRDNWLIFQESGIEIIEQYYETAPKIVLSIDSREDAAIIYREIWADHLSLFFSQIQHGEKKTALKTYLDMVKELEAKYFDSRIC